MAVSYDIKEKLPPNLDAWMLLPDDKVEINYFTKKGKERRLVFENIQIDYYAQPDDFKVRGRTVSEDEPKEVLLWFCYNEWSLTLESAPEEDPDPQRTAASLFASNIGTYHWLLSAWGLIVVSLYIAGRMTSSYALAQGMLLGLLLAVADTLMWLFFADTEQLSTRHRRLAYMGAVMTIGCLFAGLILNVW